MLADCFSDPSACIVAPDEFGVVFVVVFVVVFFVFVDVDVDVDDVAVCAVFSTLDCKSNCLPSWSPGLRLSSESDSLGNG